MSPLVSYDWRREEILEAEILIIGSGVAALSAAIEAAKHRKVLLVTKAKLKENNTYLAQGGVAVAMDEKDIATHFKDTIKVGKRLNCQEAVEILTKEGRARVNALIEWGAKFDREGGKLSLAQEAGHTQRRIIHAKGDATGQEIERVLIKKVKENHSQITILENTFVIDLLCEEGVCRGAVAYRKGVKFLIVAEKTILATGGGGQIYRESTNVPGATGDGFAIAYRAGAALLDMEMIQFHPTTLYLAGASRALISEAIRGEGGILRNKYGERFMFRYHPRGELAPRDITSRAILKEIQKTKDTQVYLDLRHLNPNFLKERFPLLTKTCQLFNLRVEKDLIPVRPTAHYFIGGVRTNVSGETGLKDLFACGEVACVGVHGANRLASNSLLEGLVFGYRAGLKSTSSPSQKVKRKKFKHLIKENYSQEKIDLLDLRNSLRSLMWRNVGIEREETKLKEAGERIDFWMSYVLNREFKTPLGWELQNMLLVAKLIQTSALSRTESRGVHYRRDYPRPQKSWETIHLEQKLLSKLKKKKL